MNNKIFIALNADDVGGKIGDAILNDDHEGLSSFSQQLNEAHGAIDEWVQSNGGRVIAASGDEGIYQVPVELLDHLEEIQQNFGDSVGHGLTIGVGGSVSEASKALIYAKANAKGQIAEYDPSMDESIGEESGDDQSEQFENMEEEDSLPEASELQDESVEEGQAEQGGDESYEDDENVEEPEMAEDEYEDSDEDGTEVESEDGEEVVKMPKDKFIKEHKKLVDTLESPEHDDDLDEAAEQQSELENIQGEEDSEEPEMAEDEYEDEYEDEDESEDESEDEYEDESEDEDMEQIDVPADEVDGDYGSEEMEEAQPEHEKDMDEDEEFVHDAQENRDDELDDDIIEADEEENVFGHHTENGEDEEGDFESEEPEYDELSEDDVQNPEHLNSEESEDMGEDAEMQSQYEDEDQSEMGEQEDALSQQRGNQQAISDMFHANADQQDQGESEVEGEMPEDQMNAQPQWDEELREEIMDSLQAFKANAEYLNQLKDQNPELYQSMMTVLRGMIEMAKKFKIDAQGDMKQAQDQEQFQNEFPEEEQEQAPAMQKSESGSGLKQGDRVIHSQFGAGSIARVHGQGQHSVNFDNDYGKVKGPRQVHEKDFKMKPLKKPDMNVRKSENLIKARVDEGLSDKAKRHVRLKRFKEAQKAHYAPDSRVEAKTGFKGKGNVFNTNPLEGTGSTVGDTWRKLNEGKGLYGDPLNRKQIKNYKNRVKQRHIDNLEGMKAMPKPNLPKSEDKMKGVHKPRKVPSGKTVAGESEAGHKARQASSFGRIKTKNPFKESDIQEAKQAHRKVIEEQKRMKKPMLKKEFSQYNLKKNQKK
jgi:topoisomerase-4 subunit A